MKRRTTGMGRIFKRRTRLTGRELSTWWIAYFVDGKERRESSRSSDHSVAKDLLRARLHALSEGTYVGPARERQTAADLLDSVVIHYELRQHSSLRTVRGHVAIWKEALGGVRALDVTTQRLQRITQEWRHASTSSATINRRLAILRRALRLGKLRLDPARLDFTDLFLPENSPRGRYLGTGDLAKLSIHLPEYLKDFVEFAYLCGTRKQQLARTTWANWDAASREFAWDPKEVKGKVPHVLPLDGRPLEIVVARHARRALHCRYVFHGPRCSPGRQPSREYGCIGDFKRAWASANEKAGFPVGRKSGGFVFHNTRHTAVTNLVNAGVPAHEAMAVSGHRTRSVFDRYSITVKEQTRAALRAVSGYSNDAPQPARSKASTRRRPT